MVSSSAQTERRRRLREAKMGRKSKKQGSTPRFPIHPEGYDPSAPDAKPQAGKTE